MTQTAAPLIGLSTTLSIGTQGGTPTYTPINGIKKITPPNGKWGTEETTTLNTSGVDRTYDKTLRDPGEVAIEGLYESADAGQAALQAAYATSSNSANGAAYPFKLSLPINLAGGQSSTGDLIGFSALVTEWAVSDAEIDKLITFKATLKTTGAVTYTEGS